MNPRRMRAPTARRIALLADSHGTVADHVLAEIVQADLILHAGDIGARRVLCLLGGLAPLGAVRGNNDVPAKWPPAECATCARLPDVLRVSLHGGELVLVHGHQCAAAGTRHARLRTLFPDARCVVYGHSHRRVVDDADSPWVVNPGACGHARTHGGASWLGLTIDGDEWRIASSAFS